VDAKVDHDASFEHRGRRRREVTNAQHAHGHRRDAGPSRCCGRHVDLASGPRCADAGSRTDHGEQRCHESREEFTFRFRKHPGETRAPEALRRRCREVREDISRHAADVGQRPGELQVRADERIGDEERHREYQRQAGSQGQVDPGGPPSPETCPDEFPAHVGRHEGREVQQVVDAREVLQDERQTSADERPSTLRIDVCPDAEEREGHPLRREHLQMRELWNAVRREGEEQAADECGRRGARDPSHEQEHPETRQHEGREKHQVVAEHRVAAGEGHGQRDECLGNQVLGVRQRERGGVEDVAVEERGERVEIAAERAPELLHVPRQDPDVEHRVAEIPGDITTQVPRQRPGHCHTEGEVRQSGEGGLGPSGDPEPVDHWPRKRAVNAAMSA
jgi:hypothetical protein